MAFFLMFSYILRVKIKLLQEFFLPVSVLAGFFALVFGNNGLKVITFTESLPSYSGILISFIFASLPFTYRSNISTPRNTFRAIQRLWSYSLVTLFWQWAIGILFTIGILSIFWSEIHPGFGTILAAGFVGGHGTAAAIGQSFRTLGWEDAEALAMTSATVGILASIFGGIIFTRWGVRKGYSKYLKSHAELPIELKTGLIAPEKRSSMGKETVSSLALDPLLFHFILILFISSASIIPTNWSLKFLGNFTIPNFCVAFVMGVFVKWFLRKTNVIHYFDTRVMSRLSNSFTDILVVFGIASIKIEIVQKYFIPLILMFIVGLILNIIIFRFFGPLSFEKLWFEKSIFTWGWITGVTAIAITLLRMVDPDNKSSILREFAVAYMGISPVEIGFVAIVPVLITKGYYWHVGLLSLILAVFFSLVIFKLTPKEIEAPFEFKSRPEF